MTSALERIEKELERRRSSGAPRKPPAAPASRTEEPAAPPAPSPPASAPDPQAAPPEKSTTPAPERPAHIGPAPFGGPSQPLDRPISELPGAGAGRTSPLSAREAFDAADPAVRAGGSMAGFAAGAKVGAGVGAVGGPKGSAVMAIIGGALGAAGADQGLQILEDSLHRLNVPGFDKEPPAFQERVKSVADEMILDSAFSLAPPGLSALLRQRRQVVGAIFGVGREAREAATRIAADTGINLAPFQLTGKGLSRLTSEALGRFPLLGGPLKKQATRSSYEALAHSDRLLMNMGPSANLAEAGQDLTKAASLRFTVFRREINKMYAGALEMGRQNRATVAVDPILDSAQEVLQDSIRRHGRIRPDLESVKFIRNNIARDLGVSLRDIAEHGSQVTKSRNLTNVRISLDRVRGLGELWDQSMETATRGKAKEQAELLMRMKQGMEASINTLDHPGTLEALQNADAIYTRVMREVFETPTAKKFLRIDRRMFSAGHAVQGTRNPDEAVKIAFGTQSPKALQDLRKLVGDPKFNKAYASLVNDNFRASFEQAASLGNDARAAVSAVENVKQWFGFNDKRTMQYRLSREAFKNNPVQIEQMERLVEGMEYVARTAPPDFATFIARGAVLGGARRIGTAFIPTATSDAGVLSVMIGGAGFIFGGRYMTSIAANPKFAKQLEVTLNTSASMQARRAALVGLYRGLEADGILSEEDKFTEEQLEALGGSSQ